MKATVSLSGFVDTLEMLSDDTDAFLDVETGEMRVVGEDDRILLDMEDLEEDLPEWQVEVRARVREIEEGDNWIQMPGRDEIDEWAFMERFARVQGGPHAGDLLAAIRGSGAFRRFRTLVEVHGLREAWFEFRRHELEDIARRWLSGHGLTAT